MNTTELTAQILEALKELNQQLFPEQQLPLSSDTPLFGQGGLLDSLGLVNLILLVEERISGEFGIELTLANERAMSQRNSPFRSVQSLADYLNLLIRERQNG